MSMLFVDTVALLALWNESDQWHFIAHAAFLKAYEEKHILFTTTCVLLECGNAVSRKPYRDVVLDFRSRLMRTQRLIEPLAEDYQKAWDAFARRDAANAGIVDLVSFEVMRRLGVTDALTNDQHFRAAGFNVLM